MIKLKLKDIKTDSASQDYSYPDIFDYRIGKNQLLDLFGVHTKNEYYNLYKDNSNVIRDKLIDLIKFLSTKYSEDDISQFIDDLPDYYDDDRDVSNKIPHNKKVPLVKTNRTKITESINHVEERKVPSGRKLSLIKGFVTRKGAIHNPDQANRAYNPNKSKMRLKSVKKSSRPLDQSILKIRKDIKQQGDTPTILDIKTRLEAENIQHAETGGTSQVGRQNKLIQQAAFHDPDTGKVYGTGAIHNPDNLPQDISNKENLVSGFIDNQGKFITREDLAKRQKVKIDATKREEPEQSDRKVDNKLGFFIKQYGKSIPESDIKQIYETLKTGADGKAAKATNWVLRKYKDLQGEARDRFIKEDLPSTVMDALILHDKFNKKIKKAPLRKLEDVESFDQLYKITAELKELKTNKEDIANIKENQTTVLHQDENGEVLIPETEEASKYYGSAAYKNVNTRWCTAADNDNMFDFYTKKQHPNSELFIMTYKGKNGELRKAQYHPESKQFKDERDIELTQKEKQYIADNNPDMIKSIVDHRVKNDKSIADIVDIDRHFFERPENAHYKDKAIKDVEREYDVKILKNSKGEPAFSDDVLPYTDKIAKIDKDYFKTHKKEQALLGNSAKRDINDNILNLGKYNGYGFSEFVDALTNALKTYKNLGLATPKLEASVLKKVYKGADEALTGEDANINVGSQILKVATALNPNHFKENPDIQEKYLKMIESNITDDSYGFDYASIVFKTANVLDNNIENPITQSMFRKQSLANNDFRKLNTMNKAFSREEMLRRVENGNIEDASMIGVTNIYDAFKNDNGAMDKSAQPVLDNLNMARKENEKDDDKDNPTSYTLDGLKVHKSSLEHLLSTDEIANTAYKVIPEPDERGDSDITPLLSDDNWGLIKQHVEDSGGGNIPLAKLKYNMALNGTIKDGQSQKIDSDDINFAVRGALVDKFDTIGDAIISDKNKSTSILSEVLGGTFDKEGNITVPYPKLEQAHDPSYEDFASGFVDSTLDATVLPISKYNFGTKAAKSIAEEVKSTFKPDDEFNTAVKGHLTGYLTSKKNKAKRDNITHDMVASGRF